MTLDPHLVPGEAIPPALFWCLSPDAVASDGLGRDGHPKLGGFLPLLPYPRRMWAGGELTFSGVFTPGETITKTTTLENIQFKSGSTGKLCFLALRHHYHEGERLVVDERQDLVYREEAADSKAPTEPETELPLPPAGPDRWIVNPDPVMLFRYSALTFNGHRIHYDHPYSTGVEGYRGLVVHGPIQATLMLNLATARLGHLPRRFAYRGLAPLICGRPFAVDYAATAEGKAETKVISSSGVTTMAAKVEI